MNEKPTILIAEIVAAQGLRGQVRANLPGGDPQALAEHKEFTDQRGNTLSLKLDSVKGRQAIISVKGATDRNAAEKLVGTKLYVARQALPETDKGQYYFSDLEGLEVRDGTNTIGTIRSMYNFGAGDIMEILLGDGKAEMLPFTPQVVKEVNIAGGYVVIDMPDIIMVRE